MNERIVVTTLVENTVHLRGLLAEHGLAFHIQAGPHSLLFDTGQSGLLVSNAGQLDQRLDQVEAIALSHGHNDHTGGLRTMRRIVPHARLFLHPASLAPKFARNPDGTSRPIGMDEASATAICTQASNAVWTAQPTEIMDGIFVTGEIPRRNGFEDTGGRFFLDAGCTQADPLVDDQALFFDTTRGLVVLFGCAHAGVVNTLEYIQQLISGRPIHAILGGLHLLKATPERIEKTIAAFRRLNIQRLAPAHCTGLRALAQLWNAFPDWCFTCAVGASQTF